jgi:hypothetical protein
VKEATLDPFHGYKNAIDDRLEDAAGVLDAFHVVKRTTAAVDEVRRHVQQQIHGHRGRKDDLLDGIRTILRCGAEHLSDRQPPGSIARSWPMSDMTRSTSPGRPPNDCARPTRPPPWLKDAGSPSKSSSRCRPARSPRSSGSAEP